MSCTNITTCFRIGTDYKDRLITPTDGLGGLSDFRYEIKNQLGGLVKNLTVGAGLEIVGDKIVIQGDSLEDLTVGKYDAVFWLDINGQTRDLFSEQLEISADKCDCQNLYNLAFTIIPVDISENVVNIYLSWEDLTPEQILELQKPAVDAGNEVRQQVNEYIDAKELQINPVILAAENATQNANDAAQTANTAAQNADEKATAAQTAANNANDATSDANTATTNANDATLAANTAATNAQDEADAAQQTNTDIQLAENIRISNENERIGAENDRQAWEDERDENEDERILNESTRVSSENTRVSAENTRISNESTRHSQESTRQSNETTRQNQEGTRQTNENTRVSNESSRVTAENSRVSAESARVLAETARVANDANRLAVVASYTHSGNKEVVVSSFSGNTMTSVGHGLANGDRLAVTLTTSASNNGTAGILNTVPILSQMPTSVSSTGFYVINATADTFQLSATSGGSILNVNPAADFTLYKFEVPTPLILPFTSLPASNSYRVLINGGIFKEPSYIYVNGNNVTVGALADSMGQLVSTTIVFNNMYLLGNIDISVRATKGGLIINRRRELIYWNPSGNLTNESGNTRIVHFSNKTPITALQMQLVILANGATIKIIRE